MLNFEKQQNFKMKKRKRKTTLKPTKKQAKAKQQTCRKV
jgi:hypothetical protein